ncbi:zinc finger CCCH domain-containing protein 44-like [Bidens hawaiensis]|uniref:zinc finger CCCH domain-containing protein 44-like n=1 Tax=Bidens hawaiensis TaxID=980011 RepID=UPI00404928A7
MKKKAKKVEKNEDDSEEWCFVCKDGGDLIICDHKVCLKSYHPECVSFDESSGKSKSQFICGLHKCEICNRASDFQCYCCPTSVCGRCIRDADFVCVRGKKGFCDHCLKLSILVEEKKDVDSDGEIVDFNNRNTYETLYKEYWEIINSTEKLTLEDLLTAKTKLKSGKNYDSDKHDDSDEYQLSDSDENDEIKPHNSCKKLKRSKPELSGKKVKRDIKGKSNKEEFSGWGSTRVIEFLTHIGKDTTNPLSQRELENIVKRYSMENNLFIQKNKIIECDEWLRSVFKRKTIRLNRIYDSLETHLAENQVSSDDDEDEDEFGFEFEELDDEDKELVVNKRKKKSNSDDKIIEKKEDSIDVSHYQFAAIVVQNIKLVYLKKSLVLKLMKEFESFESKVVGSFVRVKEDANGFSKGGYQLMQITGVKKCLVGENDHNLILQAIETDISITSLSDDDFTEEECEDLKKKVKSGILGKIEITVLEEKARSLHRDIVSHWIPRELSLLKHRIDQANEKGWRKELFDYLKRREFLLDETNKQKLLEEVPSVVPDVEDDNKDSPKSILTHSSSAPFGITSANKQDVPASETYEMAMKLENFFASLEKQERSRKSSVVKGPGQLFDITKEKSNIEELTMADVEDTESSQWYVTSKSGDRVGPVSLSVLKNWSQAQAASKSMIYKINETKEEAKPLTAVLNLAFLRK